MHAIHAIFHAILDQNRAGSRQHGSVSQGDFQEFTSLPETQEIDEQADEDYLGEEVQDSGMDAGIDSGSDDDDVDDDDMIVLDPEHVCRSLHTYFLINTSLLKGESGNFLPCFSER